MFSIKVPKKNDDLKLGQVPTAAVEELGHPEAPLCPNTVRDYNSGARVFTAHTGTRTSESIHLYETNQLREPQREQYS